VLLSWLVRAFTEIAGLMVGNNIAGHTRLFTQIKEKLRDVTTGPVIVISAAEVTHLQSLLKKVVAGCLQIDFDDDDDDAPIKVPPWSL
jgi:Origin recognition complex (ORC) subunit 3 N-terminus